MPAPKQRDSRQTPQDDDPSRAPRQPAADPAAPERPAAAARPGNFDHTPRMVAQRQAEAGWRRPADAAQADPQGRLPASLQSGIEALSGLAMDHVRVRRDSPRPAALGALAYAQGSEIHLAPGQEAHLPHEAWHVVQQAQGRVRPTLQMQAGTAVNDDAGLEAEADRMGAAAARQGQDTASEPLHTAAPPSGSGTVQRRIPEDTALGTRVYDDAGEVGQLLAPGQDILLQPSFIVSFSGAVREVSCDQLYLEDPVRHNGGPMLNDFDADDSDEDPAHPLLAGQHAAQEAVVAHLGAVEKRRYGKAPAAAGSPKDSSLGGKVSRFFGRFKREMVVDPRAAAAPKKSYSTRGAVIKAHEQATAMGDATLGNPMVTPIESAISAAVGAAVGTGRRADRTPGTAAIVEQKVGHVVSALGNLLQTVPVIGAAAAPLAGAGTFMQEHGKGASKKQAAVRAAAATAGSAAAGAIPVYGTYSGIVGLINDCRKLLSSVDRHGNPAYVHALMARIAELEALQQDIEQAGFSPEQEEALVAKARHQVAKTQARLDKEMRRREQQERGPEGAKTALLEEDRLGSFDREDDASDGGSADF